MVSPIDPPTLALGEDDLVDWLELTALFDPFGVARLDALLGAMLELDETAEDNIGARDQARERLIERLENEVEFRKGGLTDVYPFDLSDSGDELYLHDNWRDRKFAPYLICLIATHVTGSAILGKPPVGELLTRLRNRIFQMVATLGLAGMSSGPAFSVGWPRQSGETIVELLTRASAAGGGFGQAASGKNWPGKAVRDHADTFAQAYMLDHATGNHSYVTVIPYRVLDDRFWHMQHQYHKAILDRLRLPLRAWQGLQLAAQGVAIDDADRLDDLTQWLDDFIVYAQAA